MTQRYIAKECCVNLGAANKIIKQKKETGTDEMQRKRKLEEKGSLLDEMKQHLRKSSHDLQQY